MMYTQSWSVHKILKDQVQHSLKPLNSLRSKAKQSPVCFPPPWTNLNWKYWRTYNTLFKKVSNWYLTARATPKTHLTRRKMKRPKEKFFYYSHSLFLNKMVDSRINKTSMSASTRQRLCVGAFQTWIYVFFSRHLLSYLSNSSWCGDNWNSRPIAVQQCL